jgi:hypothetical protein
VLTFPWRWAKVGDRVLVHIDPDGGLAAGQVVVVRQVHTSTELGIRMDDGVSGLLVWPSRFEVHPDPLDPSERCWRCDRVSEPADG